MVYISILYYALFNHFISHDVNLALYKINIYKNEVHTTIHFEQDHLRIVIPNIDHLNNHKIRKRSIEQFLQQNTSWRFNNQEYIPEVNHIHKEENHYIISLHPYQISSEIKKIELTNLCFLEQIEDLSNVVHLIQEEQKMRGFHMNKSRTKISIDL